MTHPGDLEREIHIWTVRTVAPRPVIDAFAQVLAPEQINRADRFRFNHLRDTYVLAAGALRILLGQYLCADPASISFVYGARGKPALPGHPPHVQFNMSHSGEAAVYAFTSGPEIGVDVEQIRSVKGLLNIASQYFCANEERTLQSLCPDESMTAFFHCWTRKEAYLKATGNGLYAPLDEVEVTMLPDRPAAFLHIRGEAKAAQEWTLHDLKLWPGYASALAFRGTPRPLRISPVMEPAELVPYSMRRL